VTHGRTEYDAAAIRLGGYMKGFVGLLIPLVLVPCSCGGGSMTHLQFQTSALFDFSGNGSELRGLISYRF
jgi:hypothetical protein